MSVKIYVLLFFVLIVAFHNASFADQDSKGHRHKTPHGGIIQEAEGMHAEFLMDKSGEPKLYLYDKAMKPLVGKSMEARLTVKGHDEAQVSRSLKPSKDPKGGPLYTAEPITGLSDWDTR